MQDPAGHVSEADPRCGARDCHRFVVLDEADQEGVLRVERRRRLHFDLARSTAGEGCRGERPHHIGVVQHTTGVLATLDARGNAPLDQRNVDRHPLRRIFHRVGDRQPSTRRLFRLQCHGQRGRLLRCRPDLLAPLGTVGTDETLMAVDHHLRRIDRIRAECRGVAMLTFRVLPRRKRIAQPARPSNRRETPGHKPAAPAPPRSVRQEGRRPADSSNSLLK